MSQAALDSVYRYARAHRLMGGAVSHVRVSQEMTREHFDGDDVSLGYFGSQAGPGPSLSRLVMSELQGSSIHVDGPHDEGSMFGPMLDFWSWPDHDALHMAMAQCMRLLGIFSPLVVIAESKEVSERLILSGPLLGSLPVIGEWPGEDRLSRAIDTSFPFGGLHWSDVQGRPVLSRCVAGGYAILIPVGHGGRVKYDPTLESETVHLLALSSKAALIAVSVAASHAREHGRPDPTDLGAHQALLASVKEAIANAGLDKELDSAREQLKRNAHWIVSRRQRSAAQRRDGAAGDEEKESDKDLLELSELMELVDLDDDKRGDGDDGDNDSAPKRRCAPGGSVVLFEGGSRSDERRAQFERLSALLDDLRGRGLDEALYPNRLCPAHLSSREEWLLWFLGPGVNLEIHASALKKSDGYKPRRSTVDRAKAGKRNPLSALAAIAGPSASSSASTSTSVASGSATASSSTGITGPADLFRLSTLPKGTSLWTVTSAVAPTFKQLATEASVEAKGIEVAGCVACLEVVTVKVDDLQQGRGWAHSCTGDRADLEVGDGRENCWSVRVYIASDLYKFPALRQAVGNVVEEHSLADVLKSIKAGPLNAYADLIPPAYTPSDQDPPVLVLPNSSAAWLAFNAIALTHSLTPGAHAELESGRNPSVRAMSGIVGAVSKARADGRGYINVLECPHQVCDYFVFNHKAGQGARTHSCRQPRGPDDEAPRLRVYKSWTNGHQLPSQVRVALLIWILVNNADFVDTARNFFSWDGAASAATSSSRGRGGGGRGRGTGGRGRGARGGGRGRGRGRGGAAASASGSQPVSSGAAASSSSQSAKRQTSASDSGPAAKKVRK